MNNYIDYINHIETKISVYCNSLTKNNKSIFYFFRIITSAGDWWMYLIYAILLLIFTNYNFAKDTIILGALSFSFHYPIYYFIKNLTKRKRPYEQIKSIKLLVKPPDRYSMPSGHSSGITIVTLILIYQLEQINFILLIPVFIALSRIFLGVHYLLDTIIGIALGYLCYNISSIILL